MILEKRRRRRRLRKKKMKRKDQGVETSRGELPEEDKQRGMLGNAWRQLVMLKMGNSEHRMDQQNL